jgi:D-galactarolactone cycloisomerase
MSHEIETVETIALKSELEEPFGYSQSWVSERSALLVRVETRDGTVGWGECWGPIAGTQEVIDDFYASDLMGRNPVNVENIHQEMYKKGRAAYQSIVPLPAISGIDIALWDLCGKIRNTSVGTLLGGKRRQSIRPYATGHYFKRESELEQVYDRIVDEAVENAARFGAIKLKIGLELMGYGSEEDVELVRRVREAVGEETTIMVDANYAYDTGTAKQVGQKLSQMGAYWFEEPVPPEHIDGYARLASDLDLRIAGGECHGPFEFNQLLDSTAVDIAQPDLCNVGGLTAGQQVRHLARAHNIQVIPHVWGTPIAIAASLQYISTLPGDPWLEFDQSSNPLRRDLADRSFTIEDSGVQIPDEPGIGITPNEDVIEEYRYD